ncbi:hypothetical protein CYY_006169 [Polysphondylium violaceum]|uniref:Swi5-domain-containing protein n=1 Tax=Polysphondylium violaceum TaxID=133409 RepID=A0A8J4URP5_9MYCE|nr:hypothetical protein CYY_006169 [Polysphondylium violaceum]
MNSNNDTPLYLDKQSYHNISVDRQDSVTGKSYKIHWRSDPLSEIESLKKELKQLADLENQLITQLEPYNEQIKSQQQQSKRCRDKTETLDQVKESCQTLIGRYAELDGVTISQMYKQLDITLDPDEK